MGFFAGKASRLTAIIDDLDTFAGNEREHDTYVMLRRWGSGTVVSRCCGCGSRMNVDAKSGDGAA
jgi:hypothetical protein